MDRRSAALLVAALVLLSGCNVLSGGEDPAAAPTPVPTPDVTPASMDRTPISGSTTAPGTSVGTQPGTRTRTQTRTRTRTSTRSPTPSRTPTPTPTSTSIADLEPLSTMDPPPGVAASGVDAETLLAAHRERLDAAPFRMEYTVVGPNGPGTEVRVVNETSARSVRIDDRGTSGFLELYVDATELGSRNTTSGEVTYGSGPVPIREFVLSVVETVRETPHRYVAAVEWEAVGVSTPENGTRRAVLEATDVAAADRRSDGNVTGVSGRMLVTSGGRIANLTLRVDTERPDGSTATQRVDYATDRYGTAAVDRPDWLSTPPTLWSRVEADSRLLRYEHTGGAAIPAGTQLNVTSGLSRVGAVTVDDPVEPGETLYIYRTGNGSDGQLRAAVGERPAVPDDAAAFSGTVTLEGWVGDFQFQSAIDLDFDGQAVNQSSRSHGR